MNFVERRMEVMKVGKAIDSAGQEHDFTLERLRAIAASYDPGNHEAPIVIGHPELNAPAYGWTKGLFVSGDKLLADVDLAPEMDEWVKKGLYKKRSVALYPDGTLRHIGFLGAMPPAIKGLSDVAFAAGDTVSIEFAATADIHEEKHIEQKNKGGNVMKMMEWLKSLATEKGVTIEDEPARPAQFTEADITARIDAGVKIVLAAKGAEFAEMKTRLDAQAATLAAREKETRTASITAFCERIQKSGKVVPAQAKLGMGLAQFAEQLSRLDVQIEFAETDGAKKKQTPLEWFESFCEALPAQVEFKETAKGDLTGGDAAGKLDAITRDKMKANTALTYSVAFAEAQRENPDLATEYSQTMRQ